MIDGTVFLTAAADSKQMGKFAVRHSAEVSLEALAEYLAVGFVNPVGRPVLGLGLIAWAFPLLSPFAFPFGVLSFLAMRSSVGAGEVTAYGGDLIEGFV